MSRKTFKITWNPKYTKYNYFNDVEQELEEILISSFNQQKSIDGVRFPKKKHKGIGRASKFLFNTGQMLRSLKVKANKTLLTISIMKGEIYEKYLHDRTHWLPINRILGNKILSIIQRNLKEQGW